MIRAAAVAAIALGCACSGPSGTVPTGFDEASCVPGPRISGEAGMGVGKTGRRGGAGLITDVDATITMAARTDGGCVGVSVEDDR